MTEVYYFSGSGHSLTVAKSLSEQLHCKITEINGESIGCTVVANTYAAAIAQPLTLIFV